MPEYSIPDKKYFSGKFGSLKEPHIFHITYGERIKKSLHFYTKIGEKFYFYRVRYINSRTLNLECSNHKNSKRQRGVKKTYGCLAKATVRVKNDIIKESEIPRINQAVKAKNKL